MAEQQPKMSVDRDRGWSPYLAGALSGVVGVLSVWIAAQYLGASTTFVRTVGLLEKADGCAGSSPSAGARWPCSAPDWRTADQAATG